MNYYSVFYWLTVSDGIKNVFDTFSNIFTFLTVISLIIYTFVIGFSIESYNKTTKSDSSDEDKKDYESTLIWRKFIGRIYWISQIICIITWLVYVMTPTKKDCLLIVAGGAVGNFITTDSSAKALPSDITKYLHLSLNKEIEDLATETKTDVRKELGIKTPKEELLSKFEKLSKDELINYLKNDSTLTITK